MPPTPQDIQRIMALIEQDRLKIQQGAGKPAVIFVGEAGAGKSTLLNYLAESKLHAIPSRGFLPGFIEVLPGEPAVAKISHGVIAETKVPNIWESQGVVYWDFPGFFANTGEVQNIVDAFYIKEIFEKSQSVKIVIVAEYSSFCGRNLSLAGVLRSLGETLREFNHFGAGISFICTKYLSRPGVPIAPQDVCITLQEFYARIFQYMGAEGAKIVASLIVHPEKVALFGMPTQAGPVPNGPGSDREKILQVINGQTVFVPSREVGVSISACSELWIKDLFESLANEVKVQIKELSVSISESYRGLIAARNFNGIQLLTQGIVQGLPLMFRSLVGVPDLVALQKIFVDLNVGAGPGNDLLGSIRTKLDVLLFCKKMAPQTACDGQIEVLRQAIPYLLRPEILHPAPVGALDVRACIVNAINAEITAHSSVFKARTEDQTSREDLDGLLYCRTFFNGVLAQLGQVNTFDGYLAMLREILARFASPQDPPDGLEACIETLKIVPPEPSIPQGATPCAPYVTMLHQNCTEVVEELNRKIAVLEHAENVLRGGFIDSVQEYMQTIDAATGPQTGSVEAIRVRLLNLRDRLAAITAHDRISLQDVAVGNFAGYPQASIDCLQTIDCVTYPELKVSADTKERLMALQTSIQSLINWYDILPKVYHYLSVNHPTLVFQNGITAQTFAVFLQTVAANEPGTNIAGVICDGAKLVQLNKLIEDTWRDDARHVVSEENDYETVTVTGNCVKISDILPHLTDRTKVLKVECFNTIYFDQNLVRPGMTLMIIAPRWKIDADVTVNLSGANAQDLGGQAASGAGFDGINGRSGADGLPGLPGQNSGSFYGKGQEFIGLEHLTVMANGGNGGVGQIGGNGSNGQDGQAAPQVHNNQDTVGTLGGAGGAAGAGGAGGVAGNVGTIKISGSAGGVAGGHHRVLAANGANGVDGANGQPGIGGINGPGWHCHHWTTTMGGGGHPPQGGRDCHLIPANPSKAADGYIPAQRNIAGRLVPPNETAQFAPILDTLVYHFREAVTQKLATIPETITLKIQRPVLVYTVQHLDYNVAPIVGNALVPHPQSTFWHKYWSEYSREGLCDLLKLRLDEAKVEGVKIFAPNYIWNGQVATAHKLTQEILLSLTEYNKTILIPLNLYGKHWVGMIIERNGDDIKIHYVDPEQTKAPKLLGDALTQKLRELTPNGVVDFVETKVEPQKYNNCGPELIEHFMHHLTGKRATQDSAVEVHSSLLEGSLLMQ